MWRAALREQPMHRHTKSWLLVLATATLAFGCATSSSPENDADTQLDAMLERARIYKGEAEKAPDSVSPERKAGLQQLANDARAWQARTGRNDIRVTDRRLPATRRANDSGDAGNCDADCPVYTLEGDTICFLEKSECSSNPEDYGTICVYSCISMASETAPERSQGE
jgi:hypothetical protein